MRFLFYKNIYFRGKNDQFDGLQQMGEKSRQVYNLTNAVEPGI